MKTILAATGLALVLLIPTGATAKPDKSEREADEAAFNETYGTNKNGKNAFGKCVSGKASEKKAAMDAADAQKVAATKNAAKQCAAERAADEAAFKADYGTNKDGRNAFGKCVSRKTSGGS